MRRANTGPQERLLRYGQCISGPKTLQDLFTLIQNEPLGKMNLEFAFGQLSMLEKEHSESSERYSSLLVSENSSEEDIFSYQL